uniref:excalibur calcium-binding domain-containing protein n=1 Tax=Ureibacillus sp. FSL K6-3587 TaxID=2954681 RepID=UPI001ECEFB49|nr:hypothetical protein [Bacilli bacterium]
MHHFQPSLSNKICLFIICSFCRNGEGTNGVPSTHSAYQTKLDRDDDGWACER